MHPNDLDLSDPDVFRDGFPHEYFRMLRRDEPVSWNDSQIWNKDTGKRDTGFYSVTKHEDVIRVSRAPEIFSSEIGGVLMSDPSASALERAHSMMLSMDPPAHADYRRLVQAGFTPRMVQKLQPRIAAAAKEIVDNVASLGKAEFVSDIAMHLPMTLICELMGVPHEDRMKVFDWSNVIVAFDDPDYVSEDDETADSVAQALWLYSHQLAEEKRANPDDGLISIFANAKVRGERPTAVQLNNFFVMMAVAGNETTRNATTHAIRLLHENPDQRELLRSDVARYMPGLIDEVLRFASPVMHFRRTVTQDTELRGVKLKRGDKVVIWFASANRDEDIWRDVDRFDITRDPNPHLALGIGQHFCLGASLARMQLDCILTELVTRIPDIEPTGKPSLLRSSLVAGIKSMPVEFTPE